MPNKPKTEPLFDMDLARRLYSFRVEFVDKVQKEAAKKLGVSPAYLSWAESGQRPINYNLVDKLANEFNMNRDWFSSGNGNRRTTGPEKATAGSSLQVVHTNVANIMKTIKILEKNLTHAYKQIEMLRQRVTELESNRR